MFEDLKKKFKERLEKGAIKSELNGEVIYLKKSKLPLIGDWARIYPPVNEDNSWNIKNLIFGGKKNFIKLIIVLILIGMFFLGYYELASQFKELLSNPCVQSCMSPLM